MTVDQNHHHDHGELKTRQVGFIDAGFEASIAVQHVYDNGVCTDCGTVNTGYVGIKILNEHPEEKWANALLDAHRALLLADRITRAAHLVLETTEEPPDFERDVIRHSEGHEAGQS
jgi:hypothetical protein